MQPEKGVLQDFLLLGAELSNTVTRLRTDPSKEKEVHHFFCEICEITLQEASIGKMTIFSFHTCKYTGPKPFTDLSVFVPTSYLHL